MAGDRDQLAALIDPGAWAALAEDQRTLGSQWDFKMRRLDSEQAAQRAVDAGWRPPAQVIESVEQLDALPVGSVILELVNDIDDWRFPVIRLKTTVPNGQHVWESPGSERSWASLIVDLPAQLLWSPTEKAGTE